MKTRLIFLLVTIVYGVAVFIAFNFWQDHYYEELLTSGKISYPRILFFVFVPGMEVGWSIKILSGFLALTSPLGILAALYVGVLLLVWVFKWITNIANVEFYKKQLEFLPIHLILLLIITLFAINECKGN